MSRCVICERRIWPLEHYGFVVESNGAEVRWHRSCQERITEKRRIILALVGKDGRA